jgi:hypothetical protein
MFCYAPFEAIGVNLRGTGSNLTCRLVNEVCWMQGNSPTGAAALGQEEQISMVEQEEAIEVTC